MRTKTFYIGLTLIISSFIVCLISFYLLVFGIPTFLIGAILIFLSKQTIKTKLLTTLIPLVLYIPCTFLFLFIYNYSSQKTILIPKNFNGNLRVVYEENCGVVYEKKEGVKTLTFPDNGILILNEDFDNHVNYKYYLVDKLGNKTEIPQIFDSKDRVQKRSCVLVGGSGTIGQTVEANSISKEGKEIFYKDFFVYNKYTIDRNDYKSQQRFDSLTTVIVNQCRRQK